MKSIKKSLFLLCAILLAGSFTLAIEDDALIFPKNYDYGWYPSFSLGSWTDEDIMAYQPIDLSKIKDGIISAGHFTLEQGAHLTDWALEQVGQGYDLALETAPKALEWAQDKTSEGVIAWIGDHPYASITAAVAPICLYLGYKLGSSGAREAEEQNS